MRIRSAVSVTAALLALLVVAAAAYASTAAERERWAKSVPRVASHGTFYSKTCPFNAAWRNDEGGVSRYGPACTGHFSGIPVHTGGKVFVATRPEATAVRIGLSVDPSESRPTPNPRSCAKRAPGRWRCSMPAPLYDDTVGYEGKVFVRYPGARTQISFGAISHPPDH